MSQLFLSHSSHDNAQAIALRNWLTKEGWNDVFLDLDPDRGILPGERWERALYQAANRCDAVLFLISNAWLKSEWCRKEFRLAHRLNKQIFGLLIEEVEIAALPGELTDVWQLTDLVSGQHELLPEVALPDGRTSQITFATLGLQRLRNGLNKAGLDPRFFPWPPAHDPNRPPYRGLLPLEAEDAGIFFGREAPIIELLARFRGLREAATPRFLAILGASGAGKSSFLRAGLLPRLARDPRNFLVLPVIRPDLAVLTGSNGLLAALEQACSARRMPRTRKALSDALSAGPKALIEVLSALAKAAAIPHDEREIPTTLPTLILPIDQGEELFLTEGLAEAQRFLELLRSLLIAEEAPLIVVFTIRSDAYECLQTAQAIDGIAQQTFSLSPMPKGAYQQIIEGPAHLLARTDRALKIEPQLTLQLLQDLERGGSRDALPLLAFTMEYLYRDYGGDGDLRLDEYEEMGGIEGAIKAAIEKALTEAIREDPRVPRERSACLALLRRGLIPWLAGIDPRTKQARRRVARLSEVPLEARPLIEHFVTHRLLATDQDEAGNVTVEPAHEALLRQWPELLGWLEEDAADLGVLDALQSATRDWEANIRDNAWLLHAKGRLEDAELMLGREDFAVYLSKSEREYLQACRQAERVQRDKELEDALQLHEAQRKVVQRTRVGLIVSLMLLILSGVATIWAVTNARNAEIAKLESDQSYERTSSILKSFDPSGLSYLIHAEAQKKFNDKKETTLIQEILTTINPGEIISRSIADNLSRITKNSEYHGIQNEQPSISTIKLTTTFADLFATWGHYEEAQLQVELADNLTKKIAEPLISLQAEIVILKGRIAGHHRKHDKAIDFYESALHILDNSGDKYKKSTARAMYRLANGLVERERPEDLDRAEKLAKKALDIQSSQLGKKHEETLNSMNILARIYRAQYHSQCLKKESSECKNGKLKLKESISLYEKTLNERALIFPEYHNSVLTSLNNLAYAHHVNGDLDLAEKLFNKAYQIRKTHYGSSHQSTMLVSSNLASVLLELGGQYNLQRAIELACSALTNRLEKFDDVKHSRVTSSASTLYRALSLSGHTESADAVYSKYLAWLMTNDNENLDGLHRRSKHELEAHHSAMTSRKISSPNKNNPCPLQ